jgi:hypothetical protein
VWPAHELPSGQLQPKLEIEMNPNNTKFYTDGAWVAPKKTSTYDVVNPATEEAAGQISMGTDEDVNVAVAAARRAFASYSLSTRQARLELLNRIIDLYQKRRAELARTMTEEMGTPITFSTDVQTNMALGHFKEMVKVLATYDFESFMGGTLIALELALEPGYLKARSGARSGVHRGPETQRNRSAEHYSAGGNPSRGGRSEGRVQPCEWRRPHRR